MHDHREIEFADFSGDGLKDILVERGFDVRGNESFNLYVVDTAKNRFKKVKDFDKIKNPNYLPRCRLIDNYVSSGTDWTAFYEIKGYVAKDLGIIVYDNHCDNSIYKRDYKRAIKKILANRRRPK